jgi:hypothetical protein
MYEPLVASIIRRLVAEAATSALPDAPVRIGLSEATPSRRTDAAYLRRRSASQPVAPQIEEATEHAVRTRLITAFRRLRRRHDGHDWWRSLGDPVVPPLRGWPVDRSRR